MHGSPFFTRSCPTCGRTTQIKVTYLGKKVGCRHCGREFTADDPETQSAAVEDPVHYWINYTKHEIVATEEVVRHPR